MIKKLKIFKSKISENKRNRLQEILFQKPKVIFIFLIKTKKTKNIKMIRSLRKAHH